MLLKLFSLVRPASTFLQFRGGAQFSKLVSHRIDPDNSDSVPFDFTDANYKEVDKILAKYPKKSKRGAVMGLLHLAQKQNDNFLSLSAMKKIAKILEIPDIDVYEVASFYTMYNREKVGKFHLQICGTTPCLLCGSRQVTQAIEGYTKTKLGRTSKNGLWTLEEVECLGACANAPMIQVNGEDVYEDLTPESVVSVLKDLEAGKKPKQGPQINRNNCEGPQGRTTLVDKNYIVNGRKFDRDFVKAKKDWEIEREKARIEAEKKKAQEAAKKKAEEEAKKKGKGIPPPTAPKDAKAQPQAQPQPKQADAKPQPKQQQQSPPPSKAQQESKPDTHKKSQQPPSKPEQQKADTQAKQKK